MNSKLTLKLNEKVIQRAKKYARSRNTSLSKIVENYFNNLTSEEKSKEKFSPFVQEITGIISETDISGKEREEYIKAKYS